MLYKLMLSLLRKSCPDRNVLNILHANHDMIIQLPLLNKFLLQGSAIITVVRKPLLIVVDELKLASLVIFGSEINTST